MPQPAVNKHATQHCDGSSPRPAVSLPVVSHGKTASQNAAQPPSNVMRPSRNATRRAIVLILVQFLIIAHIIHWAVTGTSLSPVEPSESMQLVTDGVINAGAIFFALALLSTLIFGRFFCGWGCHVVMLQDFCAWIMKKCGIRPRPFRSRLLIFVPLLLALYMFVWPLFFRWALVPFTRAMDGWWGHDAPPSSFVRNFFMLFNVSIPFDPAPPLVFSLHLTTDAFWDTFAPWPVAIPFLFVCGFATVYFLGSKGFCTYGCPYGGFFAPLDEFAPGRIRVTDDCEQCGHCTAVCTSNVRVHEEVREYRMVIDPGCMKCMDCVSVCPNDALYFGFGKPAASKGQPKHKSPRKSYSLSWPEEFACAIVFAITFFSVRGGYGIIPMLFAAGIAGCMTFLAWKSWRLFRDPNVNLYRFNLKLNNAWRSQGIIFALLMLLLALLTLQVGAVNLLTRIAGYRIDALLQQARDPNSSLTREAFEAHLRNIASSLELARPLSDGGIGLTVSPRVEQALAGLRWELREYPAAAESARRIIRRAGHALPELDARDLFIYLADAAAIEEANTFAKNMLHARPRYQRFREHYVQFLASRGQIPDAIAIAREALALNPDDLHFMRRLSLLLLADQQLEESIALIKRTLDIEPDNPFAWFNLARAHWLNNQPADALAALDRSANLAPPNQPELAAAIAELYAELRSPHGFDPRR